MKTNFLTVLLIAFSIGSFAQKSNGFGIKAGINYNANGDYRQSVESNLQNPDRNIGYHIGVFGKFGNNFYVKPELLYTATKSDYDSDNFDMKKVDLPVMVGKRIVGPLNVFAGPAFQYILDTKLGSTNIDTDRIKDEFSVGFNFGVALFFNKIAIDLRYERGFNSNEANFLSNNGVDISRLDTRPDQIIAGLSFKL